MRTMHRRASWLTIPLLAVAALAGCDRFAQDPGARVVAVVGGRAVTVAELQTYLDANLVHEEIADGTTPGDLARVKSRLFDDYLDDELLFQEATRRKLTVSPAELEVYLSDAPPGRSDAVKAAARRDLTIQKLREAVVHTDVHVTEAEIDAWLAGRTVPSSATRAGSLRTLRLASYPEATRVRQEILSKKLSFSEAQEAYGADSIPDEPGDADLNGLPDNIAAAVRALKPGEVSAPLPFESSVLLFLLEPPADAAALEARRREAARRAVALDRAQAVEDKLLRDLRAKTKVVRHPSELPFAYVAEGAPPHAK